MQNVQSAMESLEERQLLSAVTVDSDTKQLSTTGEDSGSLGSEVHSYAIAYNAVNDEYLLAYIAYDADFAETTGGEREVYVQRISSRGNAEDPIRISDVGGLGNSSTTPVEVQVTWNADRNEYLVVWSADDIDAGLDNNELDIFGQRLDAKGEEIGENDFRISFSGNDGDDKHGFLPDVDWNPVTNEYMVIWAGSGDRTVYGQRLNEDGQRIGSSGFRIADSPDASDPSIAVNSRTGEYLVSWYSEENRDRNNNPNETYQVFAQLLESDGDEIGRNDFQVSRVDSPDDIAEPKIAYNNTNNQYLVTWVSSDTNRGLAEDEMEVFAQIILPDGERNVEDDIRISDVAGTGDARFSPDNASAVWNSLTQEYLITWDADDSDQYGIGNNEMEIFGQRLTADAKQIGVNDLRISSVTDDDSTKDAVNPVVAWNSAQNQYFVSFLSEITLDGSQEVFAERLEVTDSVSLDLSDHFDVDVVANRAGETPDGGTGGLGNLITNEWARGEHIFGNGLPDDGVFRAKGIHPGVQLGYHNLDSGFNAVDMSNDGDEFILETSRLHFDNLYVYGFAQDTAGPMAAYITYADGETQLEVFSLGRWTASATDGPHSYRLAGGMDYQAPDGSIVNSDNAYLHAFRFDTDVGREIVNIRIRSFNNGDPAYIMGVSGVGYAPQTYVVTTLDDELDGNLNVDDVSLREAIRLAWNNPYVTDTIEFANSLLDQTIQLKHGRLEINSNVTINGPGANHLAISGEDLSEVFYVAATVGDAEVASVTISNGFNRFGGAIVNRGDLTLRNISVTDSQAERGGALWSTPLATTHITGSEFSNNIATSRGGAIYNESAVHITNSTISGNAAYDSGGAIYAAAGVTNVISSTLMENRADADDNASTLQKAFGIGGGITSHVDATVAVNNSVIARNVTGPEGSVYADDLIGAVSDHSSHNLIGSTRGGGFALQGTNNNLVGYSLEQLDDWFSALGRHGGETQTHRPLPGNPVLDAGDETRVFGDFDQRGEPFGRVSGGRIDIGAVEVQGIQLTAPATTQNHQPEISWQPVVDAVSYRVEFFHQGSGITFHAAVITDTNYVPDGQLPIGRYTVRVRANYSDGNATGFTEETMHINTRTELDDVEFHASTLPTLEWDAVIGATSYEVWINNLTTGESKVVHEHVNGASFTPSQQLSFGRHRVWVRAKDASGQGALWSRGDVFNVGAKLNDLGASTFDRTPTLQWTAPAKATAWEIYVQTSDRNVIRETINGTNWNAPELPAGRMRWWVRGFAANGTAGAWSPMSETFIGGRSEMLSPVADSTTASRPTFRWTSVEGAGRYVLYVRNAAGDVVLRRDNLTATSIQASDDFASGSYRVWVKSISAADNRSGYWSRPMDFVVS